MPKLDERGVIIQFLMLLIVAAGLVGGLYLVQHPQIFKPKAANEGTRIEIFGPAVAGDKTTSRNIKLRIIYVAPTPTPTSSPTPTPSPSPTPSPTPRPLPTPFSKEWGVDWEKIPAGSYTLSFSHANGTAADTNAVLPGNIGLEVREKATTEVKLSSDDEALDCGQNYCVKYYPDGSVSSGQLKVETVPARGFKITVTASSVLGISSSFPTHFRVANDSAQALSNAKEYSFSQNNQEIDWELSAGNGLKTIFAQFKIDGVWNDETIVSSQITLEEAKKAKIDLAVYYRDPEITKTHYFFEGLTATDKKKHPDWDPNAPRNALWFEMINDHTWRQYNYNPADVNNRCAYDEWSFDDQYVYYINTTHGPNCDASGKLTQSVFEPYAKQFPRYWDESQGPVHISGSHNHLDVQNGQEICRKKDEFNNSVLGWEELAPGVKAIHIKIQTKTVSSTCPYDKDFINKIYEEHYWLASMPIDGQPGKEAWGIKRAMGGNVEDQWAREKKGECNFSRDQYAWDEIAKLRSQNNCPFYWDIWNDLYHKLPENMPTATQAPISKGKLRVETKPALGANITVIPLDSSGEPKSYRWGVSWEEFAVGKYKVHLNYPYKLIKDLEKIVDINPGVTTEMIVNFDTGDIQVLNH